MLTDQEPISGFQKGFYLYIFLAGLIDLMNDTYVIFMLVFTGNMGTNETMMMVITMIRVNER
ncbi:MAG: hypothetical protein AMK69_20950 [Nitrospira bacterium SG8_3]|nr:MAG: hypothetical protein AMK69_20950 [Nitrospira bacterium SG8_3]